MILNKEKVQAILSRKGVRVDTLVNDVAYNKACDIVYKAIPIPFRWFVGKNKIKYLLNALVNKFFKTKTEMIVQKKSASGRF